MKKIPKSLATSTRRQMLIKQAKVITDKIEKSLPISKAYLVGSFLAKKKKPYDIDIAILLKTPVKSEKENWSIDLVITPDNKYGQYVLRELKHWGKKKYGNSANQSIRLK